MSLTLCAGASCRKADRQEGQSNNAGDDAAALLRNTRARFYRAVRR